MTFIKKFRVDRLDALRMVGNHIRILNGHKKKESSIIKIL